MQLKYFSRSRKTSRWKHRPLSYNLTGVLGQVHVALNRHFVDFCLNDNRSLELRGFFRGSWVPDEGFFATVNHNPDILGVPGSYFGKVNLY